jgi:hypothetical protein
MEIGGGEGEEEIGQTRNYAVCVSFFDLLLSTN